MESRFVFFHNMHVVKKNFFGVLLAKSFGAIHNQLWVHDASMHIHTIYINAHIHQGLDHRIISRL